MVIPPEEDGLNEARYSDNNIIISDSTLCNILPPQLNNMTSWYKVMCSCECYISSKSMNSSLLTWHNFRMKHLKDRSRNALNIRSNKISGHIFETCKNYVRPHGCHIYNTAADISMATMCLCTSKSRALILCKCILCCFRKCPSIVLPSQEAINIQQTRFQQ